MPSKLLSTKADVARRPRVRASVALLLLAPAPSVGVVAGLVLERGALGVTLWALAKVWLFGLPLAWHRWVDQGPWSWSPPRRGGLGVALLVGLAMSVAIAVAFATVGQPNIDPQLLREKVAPSGLTNPRRYAAAAAYWIFVNALLEEYVYRWFAFRQAEVLLPAPGAVVLSAAIFTVHHLLAMASYFPWWLATVGSLGVFLGGVIWSVLYLRYQSIWPAYAAHAPVDVAVFAIGGWLLFR